MLGAQAEPDWISLQCVGSPGGPPVLRILGRGLLSVGSHLPPRDLPPGRNLCPLGALQSPGKSSDGLCFALQPPGKPEVGPVQQFVIKEDDRLEGGGSMSSSKGQLAQGRLNGEKPSGEGRVALPEKKTLPFRIGPPRRNAKLFGPDPAPAAPPKAEEKVPLAGAPAAEASEGPPDSRPGTAAARGKGLESPRKETAQGRAKPGRGARGKRKETGADGEELGEERGKGEREEGDVAEGKKGPGEALAAASQERGDARKGPEGAQQAEAPAGGGGEQGPPGAAAEVEGGLEEAAKVLAGEGREDPEESPDSSQVSLELPGVWEPPLPPMPGRTECPERLGLSPPQIAHLLPPKMGNDA